MVASAYSAADNHVLSLCVDAIPLGPQTPVGRTDTHRVSPPCFFKEKKKVSFTD